MNSFQVVSAVYDGTAPGETNPIVFVSGICNGQRVFPNIFWKAIQQANNYGGASAVQSLLTVAFLNFISTAPFQEPPIVPASASPLPAVGTPENPDVSCSEALVGTWSA